MNDEYRRQNDINILGLQKDVASIKASTFDLHAEVREVLGAVKSSQKWITESAQVTRDVRDNLTCPTDDEGLCRHAELSAKSAVKMTFAIMGVDVDVPSEVKSFQENLRFSEAMRSNIGRGTVGMIALIFTMIGAAILSYFHVKTGGS